MIKNIIFDMGGVLIRWDPVGFVRELGLDEIDSELLLKNTYGCKLWTNMDWGLNEEEDVYEFARANLPERLHPYAYRLIHHWANNLQAIPGMKDFVHDCKLAGFKVYLLSNASHKQKDYWGNVPGNEYFDGRIVSAEVCVAKPDRRIFEILCKTYDLDPGECLFLDDMWFNVVGAIDAGLHGYVFDGDADRLRRLFPMLTER